MKIITPSKDPVKGFEACPDPWAKLHVFFNPETGQVIPARCKRWSCQPCALVNYYRIDHLLSAGNPERFITLTRAGQSPKEINLNLKHLVQGIRRLGKTFEYSAVVELHKNGQPHLHLLQRGDFIEQAELSRLWETYTAKSYAGQGSFIVDIRRIDPKQNVKGYLLKYIKKSWEKDRLDPKGWASLIAHYPGLHHYRMSRNWLPAAAEKAGNWQLLPVALLDMVNTPLDPVEELFYTGNQGALSPAQELAVTAGRGRKKAAQPKRPAKNLSVTGPEKSDVQGAFPVLLPAGDVKDRLVRLASEAKSLTSAG